MCLSSAVVFQARPKGYGSIAHEEWAIDPWPLRAKGLIVLVSSN